MEREVTPEEYISSLPEERKKAIIELRNVIRKNLDKRFQERISGGMLSYCVPHSIYPPGYHVNPKQALPLMYIASQKGHIALYHMGIYADKKLLEWFTSEYKKSRNKKPDMGKSCIRFKSATDIPYELIGTLAAKLSVDDWIKCYENVLTMYKSSKK
jgi:hypothetical protein